MHLRLGLVTAGTALAAAVFLFAFYANGFALETDPASVIRGSLGVAIDDLDPGSRLGSLCFLLNGAGLLVLAAIALIPGGRKVSRAKRTPRDADSSGYSERSPGAG
jgi:hypothetical protein